MKTGIKVEMIPDSEFEPEPRFAPACPDYNDVSHYSLVELLAV